ncbi:MAG TPA: FadR/GntR family transcriptional regulator [Egibacteraceae bacterium]|nr:FadR/GntR family transcriptional regulator [Egibacteraceae bacterium]
MVRSLLYERVLEDIKGQLIDGVLGPGDRLPTIAEMALQTGVSQPSVREAYRILESMGILEITQGRGTFVSTSFADPQETIRGFQFAESESLAHLFESRRILEPSIAAFAAERGTDVERDAIVATAREMEALHACGGDFLEPDVRFHELVVAAAHNPVMAKMLATVNELLLDSRRRTMRIAGADEKAVNYHLLIGMAIRDRDADAARALMLQHVTDVEQDATRRLPARGDTATASDGA